MTENGTASNGSGPTGTAGPEGHRLPGLMDWYDTLPEKAQRLVANVILERGALISALTDQRRNLDQDCGYPEGYVQPQTYQQLYDRESIAARVVEVYPLESWQVQPTVYEDEDPGTETEFEKAWDALGKSLSAATGYYRAEMGSVVWEYIVRADVLSGVGQYGVILLGLDDGKDLSEPAEFIGPVPPVGLGSAPDATPEQDRPGGGPGPTGGPDVPPPGVLPAGTADIGTGMGRPSGGQPLGFPVRNALRDDYTRALLVLERGFQTNQGAGEGVDNAFCATGQGGGIDPSCSPGESRSGAPQDLQKVKKALRKSDRLMAEAQQLGFEAAEKYSQAASGIPAVHSDLHAAIQVARMHSLTEGYTAAQKYAVKALHLAVKAGITGGPTFTSINTALGAVYKAKVATQEAHRLRRVAYKVRRKATGGNTTVNAWRPVRNAAPRKPTRRLLFLRVFPETMATIASYDTNPASPRFGQPTEYVLTFLTPTSQGGGGMATLTTPVHWTRCIHVADNLGSSEVFGTPRQQQVLNRLLDLRKLYGGSAEMYWRGAFPGYSIETLPQLGTNVEIDPKELRDQMYRWANGLQRYVQFTGMSMKGLSPQVVDPTGQINTQLEAICIKIGVPKRIFMGSERGELASSQDEDDWNDKLEQRQNLYVTPRIIVPFVDRLIALGVLPPPAEGYLVEWPGLSGKSESQQATIGGQRTTALVAYAGQPAAPALMAPMDFFTRIMGFTEDEAQTIVDNAEEEKKRIQAEEDAKAKQQAKVQADALAKAQAQQAAQAPPGPDGQAPPSPGPSGRADQPPGGGVPSGSAGGGGNPTGNVWWDYEEDAPLGNAKAALTGGRWVTIEGSPVYVKGGKVVAGPKALKGEVVGEGKAAAPVGKAVGDATPKSTAAHPEGRAAVKEKVAAWADEAVKAGRLTAKAGAEHKKVLGKVLDAMTDGAAGAFYANINKVEAYRNPRDLTKVVHALEDVGSTSTHAIMGCYHAASGSMHLTPKLGSQAFGTYAHEVGHVLDEIPGTSRGEGRGRQRHSSDEKWSEAYGAEIRPDSDTYRQATKEGTKDVPLSHYARTNAREGFAEYYRLVHEKPAEAKSTFPQSWAFFKSKGLV